MPHSNQADTILGEILACKLCQAEFLGTKTAHSPRPVAWFLPDARILIAGQAPGLRVHESGVPFDDRSGDRLREWLGVGRDQFYDKSLFAVVPMAFCFPGYNAAGHDRPPPKRCAATWRARVLGGLRNVELTILVGSYAQAWHLGGNMRLQDRVENWAAYAPDVFVTPHPSWRNTGWIKRNPWFESDLLPQLQARVRGIMDNANA